VSIDLTLFSPAGVIVEPVRIRRARKSLQSLGFDVAVDPDALARHQRFAGDDATRLAALHRVARAAPAIAMAARGGYGLTRLLPHIDWKLIARSIERGTRWVGHSDLTALQLGLLGKVGAVPTWAGPLARDQFGRSEEEGGVDEVTAGCFAEAMRGELEAVGFRTEAGFDGLDVRGTLWGGNLAMVQSLLGTPYWPQAKIVKGGVLFLEDVNDHPYRIERAMLQLHQAGVLDSQKAIVLGHVSGYKPAGHDRGYTLKTMVAYLRQVTKTPILTGLPFGHVPMIVTMPIGVKVTLAVSGRDAFIAWGHA
jgi:muramoyltetrapeptide carboxypeptidase